MTPKSIDSRPTGRHRLSRGRWVALAVLPVMLLDTPAAGRQRASDREAARVAPTLKLIDDGARDQDDMCVWVHPSDPSLSRIVTSDKSADKLFVYDLDGRTIQTIGVNHPGNVDVRYGVPLGDRQVDIVAVNQRSGSPRIVVFTVDPGAGRLTRVDDGGIATPESTGGTLFRSPKTGRLYFIVTSEDIGTVDQFELTGTPAGKMTGKRVRSWRIRPAEGAVGDDENGLIYIADEAGGVWEVGGEPGDPTPGRLAIEVGQHGLAPDVEGLAIYKQGATDGYLIVSNQSLSQFNVYTRKSPHAFVGAFGVEGARNTDGIDIVSVRVGDKFPKGVFACHTDLPIGKRRPVLLTPFERLAQAIGLRLDAEKNSR